MLLITLLCSDIFQLFVCGGKNTAAALARCLNITYYKHRERDTHTLGPRNDFDNIALTIANIGMGLHNIKQHQKNRE